MTNKEKSSENHLSMTDPNSTSSSDHQDQAAFEIHKDAELSNQSTHDEPVSSVHFEPSEPKSTVEASPAANPAPVYIKKGGRGLSLLSLALVCALGGGGYYLAEQQMQRYELTFASLKQEISQGQQTISSLNEELANIHTSSTKIESDVGQSLAEIDQKSASIASEARQNQSAITSLQKAFAELKGRKPNDWLLAEAEYLIKLALHQIQYDGDVNTAMTLLYTADQRISDLNDPAMLPLRRTIAGDIQTLKGLEQIDVAGLVAQLMGLQQQVAQLPLASAMLPEESEQAAQAKNVSTDVNDWKQNLQTSLKDFVDEFITYRKRDGSVIPLLTPAQNFYLQENVKANPDQAISAVYHEQPEVYMEALNMATTWVKSFYDVDASITQGFLETLNALTGKNVYVEMPLTLDSRELITDLITERSRRMIVQQLNEVDPS